MTLLNGVVNDWYILYAYEPLESAGSPSTDSTELYDVLPILIGGTP